MFVCLPFNMVSEQVVQEGLVFKPRIVVSSPIKIHFQLLGLSNISSPQVRRVLVIYNWIFFLFLKKDTSLTIINIKKETKLNVHEDYTKSKRGEGRSIGASGHLKLGWHPLSALKTSKKREHKIKTKSHKNKDKQNDKKNLSKAKS